MKAATAPALRRGGGGGGSATGLKAWPFACRLGGPVNANAARGVKTGAGGVGG